MLKFEKTIIETAGKLTPELIDLFCDVINRQIINGEELNKDEEEFWAKYEKEYTKRNFY